MISQRILAFRGLAALVVILLILAGYSTGVIELFESRLQASDNSILFQAIESGPLGFAVRYSSDFANDQLHSLMKPKDLLDRHFIKVAITSGMNNAETFASWQALSFGDVAPSCTQTMTRTYPGEERIYPFKVEIVKDVCQTHPSIAPLRYLIVAAGLGICAIVGLLVFLVLMPVIQSVHAARDSIKNGRLGGTIRNTKISYKPVANLLQLAESYLKSQNLVTIAQTTAQIAHDIRAPLSVFAKVAFGDSSTCSEDRKTLQAAYRRVISLTDSIKRADLATVIQLQWRELELGTVVDNLRVQAESVGKTLNFVGKKVLYARLDTQKVVRAVENIVLNAIEACESSVNVHVIRRQTDLIIKVIDDGPGIKSNHLQRVFDEGVSIGKPNGSGLGLSFTRKVAEGHGGQIEYHRHEGYTTFSMLIPFAFIKGDPKKSQRAKNAILDKEIHVLIDLPDSNRRKLASEILMTSYENSLTPLKISYCSKALGTYHIAYSESVELLPKIQMSQTAFALSKVGTPAPVIAKKIAGLISLKSKAYNKANLL